SATASRRRSPPPSKVRGNPPPGGFPLSAARAGLHPATAAATLATCPAATPMTASDTIAAIATAPGAGGVGIVRLSGPKALAIACAVCGGEPAPRRAVRAFSREADGAVIDDGSVLAFPGPPSSTGEDVTELQAHGSPVVLQRPVERCRELGARQA